MPVSLPAPTTSRLLRDFVADELAAVHAYDSLPAAVRHMVWGPRDEVELRARIERMLAT